MNVKIKKLTDRAKTPSYAKKGDAGMDLTATSKKQEGKNVVYGTGLAMEIPEGYVGLLFPRSSLTNYDLSLGNHVGVVDSGYRGEILFKFKRTDLEHFSKEYDVGDRIGQVLIVPYPKVEFIEVADLSSSERGTNGYGSTTK